MMTENAIHGEPTSVAECLRYKPGLRSLCTVAKEREDCQRHYAEWCRNERYSYVPG